VAANIYITQHFSLSSYFAIWKGNSRMNNHSLIGALAIAMVAVIVEMMNVQSHGYVMFAKLKMIQYFFIVTIVVVTKIKLTLPTTQ